MNKSAMHILLSDTKQIIKENEALNYVPIFKQILHNSVEYYYIKDISSFKKITIHNIYPSYLNELILYVKKTNYDNYIGIHTSLLNWYKMWHRIMPWRTYPSVYKTWISEIMLQQTQVITVINYYNRFIARFPSIFELAEAKQEEVLNLWKGLGYYSRARNLHACAQKVVNEFNGQFPDNSKLLKTLPGIGDYTSGAILSIGYNLKAAAIDGNVTRILSRIFGYFEDSKSKEAFSFFYNKLDSLLISNFSSFNQALMDLGAMICKGKRPNCFLCPIEVFCISSKQGLTETIPMIMKKNEKKREKFNAIIYKKNNRYFLEHRVNTTLLKNMWGVILTHAPIKNHLLKLHPISHVFTHKIWEIDPYIVEYSDEILPVGKFVYVEEFENLPIAKAFQKITDQLTCLE